jgi:ComEC/Rec2-related protein
MTQANDSNQAGGGQVPSTFWDIKPRQLVLATAGFACGTALILAQTDRVFLAIIIVSIMALRIFNISVAQITVMVISVACGLLNAQLRSPHPNSDDISRYCGKTVVVTGTIEEVKPLASGSGWRLIVACRSAAETASEQFEPVRGNIPGESVGGRLQATIFTGKQSRSSPAEPPLQKLNQPGPYESTLLAGDSIRLRGRLSDLRQGQSLQGERPYCLLARKGIFCRLQTGRSGLVLLAHATPQEATGIETPAVLWRKSLVAFHRRVLGLADGDLLSSMVLGDRAVNPQKEISDNFRASGLSHILAASGFNLTVVAASIYFVMRLFTGNLWISSSVCLGGMLTYVLVAGPSPSVLRALLMGAILLLSRCLSRTLHMPAALTLSMFLVLLFDPGSAADVGFQLSYFSTAGMILAASHFADLFRTGLKACPRWITDVLAATLVAQSCVLPLQLYYFRQLTTYCLPANVIVSPMVAPLTILGFAGSLLFAVESSLHCSNLLSIGIDRLCYWPLELVRQETATIASLPLARISMGQARLAAVMLYYAVLLLFPLARMKARMRLWFLLFAISFATLFATITRYNQ